MKKMFSLLVFLFVTATTSSYADNNNFFGANPSGASSSNSNASNSSASDGTDYSHETNDDSNANGYLPGLHETTPAKPNNPTDFTGDEKRMQKKYKANLLSAQRLIARGTDMMKSAGNNVSSPSYKKGKILKEIGDKTLADLKANNPFPDKK